MNMPEYLPSVRALRAASERLLVNELRLVATRQQIAIVRTVVDELEHAILRNASAHELEQQLVEELARLGYRTIEVAAVMTDALADTGEDSGVFRVLTVPST